jgi:steroid delta-isomerase-like uncharacterized protein
MTNDSPQVDARAPKGGHEISRDDVIALFKRRQKAYDDLDAAALAADYTDGCLIESPMGGTHQGRDAVRAFFESFFGAFVDITFDVERLMIDRFSIAQLVRIEGTHTGTFHGLAPTGKPFHFTAAIFYELDGHQIARERRIYDFTGLMVQIGILKAKPA